MPRYVTLLSALIISLTSCYTHQASTKYKSRNHSNSILVTPVWETKTQNGVNVAPYALGVVGVAYGYYVAPPLTVGETTLGTEASAVIFGIGSFYVSRLFTKYLSSNPPKRKYTASDASEWIGSYNDVTGKYYSIVDKGSRDLMLVPVDEIDEYLAEEARLAEEKRRRNVIIAENQAKLFESIMTESSNLLKQEAKKAFPNDIRSQEYLAKHDIVVGQKTELSKGLYLKNSDDPKPDLVMYFDSDKIIMSSPSDNDNDVEVLQCDVFTASYSRDKAVYFQCYNTKLKENNDFIVITQPSRIQKVINVSEDPSEQVYMLRTDKSQMFKIMGNKNIVELASNTEFKNIMQFEESYFSTTITSCDDCMTCYDQWGEYKGPRKRSYKTVNVLCNGEKISEWKLVTNEVCDEFSFAVEDSRGNVYDFEDSAYMEIAKHIDTLCPNAEIVIR